MVDGVAYLLERTEIATGVSFRCHFGWIIINDS